MKLRAVVGSLYVKGDLFNDARRVRLAMLAIQLWSAPVESLTPSEKSLPPLLAIYPHRQRHGENVCALGIQQCAERTAGWRGLSTCRKLASRGRQRRTHSLKVPAEQALVARSQARPQFDAPLQEFDGLTAEKSHQLPEIEHARPRRHKHDRPRYQRCRHTHADCPEVDRVHVHLTVDNQLSRLQPHWPPFWLSKPASQAWQLQPTYKRWHHDHNSLKLRAESLLTKMATARLYTLTLPPTGTC